LSNISFLYPHLFVDYGLASYVTNVKGIPQEYFKCKRVVG